MKKIIFILIFANLILASDKLFYKGMSSFFGKNYKKSLYYFKKSCDLNNSKACFMIAVMYAKHKGVKKNIQKALKYLHKSCNLKNSIACYKIGLIYEMGFDVRTDYKKALEYFGKSCKFKLMKGCLNSALFYRYGEGIKINIKKSIFYYNKACNLNSAEACFALGELLKKQNPRLAKNFYKKSCKLGFKIGCIKK